METLDDISEAMAGKYPNGKSTTEAILGLIERAGYVTGMRIMTDQRKRDEIGGLPDTIEALREAINPELQALYTIIGLPGDEDAQPLRVVFMIGAKQGIQDYLANTDNSEEE